MDETPLAVAFRTFGCKVNRAESEDAVAGLLARGVRLVAEEEAAVVVVNTCTVTAEADRKARKAIRHALSLPNAPVVVAAGCLAALGAGALAALGDRVVIEPDRERVAARVAELLGVEQQHRPVASPAAPRVGAAFRTRAAVKVADGCDAFCAYCIVPYARGLPRSVSLPEVVAEVERLRAAGAAEVVLTGINIGRYVDPDARSDMSPGSGDSATADLADLVSAVAATGIARIRISSIEPLDLTDRLLATLAAHPAIRPHLHVPLQSGSDRILHAMGRSYTRGEYAARVKAARKALPGLALTTDVLVGFPGETDEDAAETRELCEELGFARLHVFRYSKRPGTRAAGMPGHLPAEVVASRAAILREADTRLRAAHTRSRIGGTAEVLIERIREDGSATGTTGDYLTVRIPGLSGIVEPGAIVSVRLARDAREGLLGELL